MHRDWPSDQPGGPLLPLLESLDAGRLREVLAADPGLAAINLGPVPGHRAGAMPLSYLAMLRCDVSSGVWRDVPGTGPLAEVLLEAGAPLEGVPGERETPLHTAASYGDAEIARVLIAAGADLEAISAPNAGGIPSASPLAHAAIFGMTDVVDELVAAGAVLTSVVLAAAAGDISGWELAETPPLDKLLAFIMAADHQRLPVLDALAVAGTPIDEADPEWRRQALRLAASRGRAASVRHLLVMGADPALRDDDGRTALDLCQHQRTHHQGAIEAGFAETERLLRAVTSG